MELLEYLQLTTYLNTLVILEEILEKDQQKFKNKAKLYLVKKGILYRCNKKEPEQLLKVIKVNEIEEVLFNNHAAIHTRHFGIETTYHRIAQNYYWPKMHFDIENYIKACDIC